MRESGVYFKEEENYAAVFTGKSRVIENIERKGRALYLESEAGTIRIWPQDEGIVRISYVEEGEFGDKQGREFADLSGSCNWSHEREGEEIRLLTEKLTVTVNLKTGSIRFGKRRTASACGTRAGKQGGGAL